MVFLLCVLDHKVETFQNFNSTDQLITEILNFKLILICKLKKNSWVLEFEVKRLKYFCTSFRTCTIILSMDFLTNKLFRQ